MIGQSIGSSAVLAALFGTPERIFAPSIKVIQTAVFQPLRLETVRFQDRATHQIIFETGLDMKAVFTRRAACAATFRTKITFTVLFKTGE